MGKIRVAMIGCGMITKRRHAPEYAENERAEIGGFFDTDMEKANALVGRYGGRAYGSVEELLADDSIDAVSICAPNFLHSKLTIQGLEAGKHILCEKPMAYSLEDSRKMMETAERTGKILMLGHNQRLLPTHRKAKEVIDSGVLGRLLFIQSNFKHNGPEHWSPTENGDTWFFHKDKAHFGVLGDLGAHKLDIIRFLTGAEVEEVFACTMTLDKKYPDGSFIDLEDNAMCSFRMTNKLHGSMHVSWTNYGEEDNSTIIYGEKGAMKIFGDFADDIVLEMHDHSTVKYSVGQISTNTHQLKSGIIDGFVDSIYYGRKPPVTGEDGHNTLAVILAGFESAGKGAWVKVTY